MKKIPSLLHFFLFSLVVGIASSSFISSEIFELHGSTGRSLLQQKTQCSVDFSQMNYTVITSQCKGPNYSRDRCCTPLKQLLCPVKDQVNDQKTNCAEAFNSYVNLYGKYPPGLFAALCKDDEQGLDCSNVPPLEQGGQQNAAAARAGAWSSLLVVSGAAAALVLYI